MRNSSLDLISLSYENHEMIDVDGHLMERKIFTGLFISNAALFHIAFLRTRSDLSQ